MPTFFATTFVCVEKCGLLILRQAVIVLFYYEDRMAKLLIPNGGSLPFGVLMRLGIFSTFCSKNMCIQETEG